MFNLDVPFSKNYLSCVVRVWADRCRKVLAALTRGREATTVEDRGTMEDAVFDAMAVFLLRQEVSPDGAAQAEAAHGTFDRDVVCRRFALNNEDGSRRWKKALVAAEPGAQGEGALLRQRRRAGAPAWRRG